MRAIELAGAFGLEHLRQVARPEPAEPGAGQVLVRVEAASLNYRDLVMVTGGYGRQSLPLIPLSDGAGRVEATGEGVEVFRPGDRVTPTFVQGWPGGRWKSAYRRRTLGGPLDGTLREWMLLEADGLVRAPRHLTASEAATLPCAAVTAWNALCERGGLRPGDSVLIQGTGGVAVFALQFALLAGAHVFVTSSSESKLARCRSMGAHELLNYREDPEWGQTVRRLSGGGVDVVLDVGGAETLEQSLRAVRPGGCIAAVGVLSGTSARIDLPRVVMQDIRIEGVTVGSRAVHERMVRAIERHGLRPVIDRTFRMEETAQALETLRAAKHFGKITVSLATPETAI